MTEVEPDLRSSLEGDRPTNVGVKKGRAGIVKHGKGERTVSTWVSPCSNVTRRCSSTLTGGGSVAVSSSKEAVLN
jgi:hypothetical protein